MHTVAVTAISGGTIVLLALVVCAWDYYTDMLAARRHENYLNHVHFMVEHGLSKAGEQGGEE